MGENNDKINIDSTNIFDEFNIDEKTKQEVKEVEKQKKKRGLNYYIYILNNLIGILNLFAFLLLIIVGLYIYFQSDKEYKDVPSLNPICSVFINNKPDGVNCYSVSAGIDKLKKDNQEISDKLYDQNKQLIEKIYRNFKFIDSKDIRFLISKSKNRLKVLDMLSDFDKIKNDFSPLNKTRLVCDRISIKEDNTIDINCSAFSGKWDSKIIGYSGNSKGQDRVEGTSISIASSFINFLEKTKPSKFIILKKPKKFSYISIIDDNGYTRKTDFKLTLKYSNNDNILIK